MVTIVIYQCCAAVSRAIFTKHIKAPTYPGKAVQTGDNGLIRHIFVRRHSNSGQRVQNIVPTRHIQINVQRRMSFTEDIERCGHALLGHIAGAHIGIIAKAVTDQLPVNPRQQTPYYRIINAHHCQTVERQVLQKFDKGIFQTGKITTVGMHMIGINIGHHRYHRLQVQK